MPADVLNAIGRLDVAAFQWLRSYHTPLLDVVMSGLSETGRGYVLWIVFALLLGIVQPRRWSAVFQALLAIGVTALLVDPVAKPFFARARPFESYLETRVYGPKPTTPSFPSGHAAGAVAGAYALSRVAPRRRVFFWVLALLMAASRIYLGVHYPLDVVVGALIGLAAGVFVIGGTRWSYDELEKEKRRTKKEE